MEGLVLLPKAKRIAVEKTIKHTKYSLIKEYSEMHQLYMDDVITKDEFLEWYRNPDNYRPELPRTNRSHMYE